jgi:hypothetical protein
VRGALHEGFNKKIRLTLDFVGGSGGSLAVILGSILREQIANESTGRDREKIRKEEKKRRRK